MKKTVGIPRGMLSCEYLSLMKVFFESVGTIVIVSPKTNKDILNKGISSCVDEACLPVKIFHGHVEYLKDKVDYLLIPKFISIYKKEYCCPKILGLPDMIKHSVEGLPKIIDSEINLNNSNSIRTALKEISKILDINFIKVVKAYNQSYKNFQSGKHKTSLIYEINQQELESREETSILLLGHHYNLSDEFLNMNIVEKLKDKNINLIFNWDISDEETRHYSNRIPKRMFWTHGRNIVGASYSSIDKKRIHGIIYLSSFGCGMDSVLLHFVTKEARVKDIPVLNVIFDEQTGEAGFNTRLEAFLDMIGWRLKNEDNISALR